MITNQTGTLNHEKKILESLMHCCYYEIQSKNASESNFFLFHYTLQCAHSILDINNANHIYWLI